MQKQVPTEPAATTVRAAGQVPYTLLCEAQSSPRPQGCSPAAWENISDTVMVVPHPRRLHPAEHLMELWVTLFSAEQWDQLTFKGFFQLKGFYGSVSTTQGQPKLTSSSCQRFVPLQCFCPYRLPSHAVLLKTCPSKQMLTTLHPAQFLCKITSHSYFPSFKPIQSFCSNTSFFD